MPVCKPDYQKQIKKAQETLAQLHQQLSEIEEKLKNDNSNTFYLRELQHVCLNITITENELEHAQQKFVAEMAAQTIKLSKPFSA